MMDVLMGYVFAIAAGFTVGMAVKGLLLEKEVRELQMEINRLQIQKTLLQVQLEIAEKAAKVKI